MFDGFVRVCAATPALAVADPMFNAGEIVRLAKEAAENGASLCAFPELSVTGYTAGDLLL